MYSNLLPVDARLTKARVACENIRFSPLFEKRMFSQAKAWDSKDELGDMWVRRREGDSNLFPVDARLTKTWASRDELRDTWVLGSEAKDSLRWSERSPPASPTLSPVTYSPYIAKLKRQHKRLSEMSA